MPVPAQQTRSPCRRSGHRRQIRLNVEACKFRMCQFFWWGSPCTGQSTGGGPYLFFRSPEPLPGEPILRPLAGLYKTRISHLAGNTIWRAEEDAVGRHRVRRLMRLLGLKAIYRKPRTTVANPDHRVYPYLLRGLTIEQPNHAWCADIERHEALLNLAVVRGHRHRPVAAGWLKLRASLSRGTPEKAEAALTTTGRASTVRWRGSGKREGKVYARNQRRKASQTHHQLEPDRSGLGSNACPTGTTGWRTPWLGYVAGREATVKDCGVAMARLQGHSWAPTPSKGSGVNVGTTWSVPAVMAGKTCRRSTLAKWGGGPVVVRARESRVHGEGVQCVCSAQARGGGRW